MLRDRTALLLLGGGAGGVMLEIKGRRVGKTKAKYEGGVGRGGLFNLLYNDLSEHY